MKSVRADKVFTPTTPARLTFVERQTINDKVVDAIQTPGKQVVVYGHSGSGKSTLLVNKLHQLYEKHITTRCMSTLTFDQICLDAFDQLRPFYSSEIAESSAVKVSAAARADYVGIKSQIGAELSTTSQRKHLRVAPPQLTPQALARFLGEAGCCWVVEDFHKIAEEEKTDVSQLMKVFMDMADVYRDLKIIAIGAVDTARQVVQYDPEMRNRVAEIQVPLMTSKEIREIIRNSKIAESAKQTAIAIFETLGAAEAKIHNTDIEKIHFHEVGAVDAIVDIVCAAVGSGPQATQLLDLIEPYGAMYCCTEGVDIAGAYVIAVLMARLGRYDEAETAFEICI